MIRALLASVALCTASSLHALVPAVDHPGALPILLGVEKVREELKLNSLQRAVLDSIRSEYKTAARALVAKPPATAAAAEKALVALNERYNKRVMNTLNPAQKIEVVAIEKSMLGGTALVAPRVQKELALTPKQSAKIASLRAEGDKFLAKVNRQFAEGEIGYFERLELLRDRRIAMGEKMLAVLTPQQRTKFIP
jgi:hypothetical protein